ncbi:hypothetical protein JCM5350_001295 [Sporobolomyces pararoseus]
MTLTADDKVTFRTSDDPPAEITASKIMLIANSTVFRDMFSLPNSTSGSESIDIAETEEDFQLFLDAMGNDETLVTGKLEGGSEIHKARWMALARLADKYDSVIVRRLVREKIREEAGKPGADGLGFVLAVNLNEKELITISAPRALRLQDFQIVQLPVVQLWKDCLKAAKAQLGIRVLVELRPWKNAGPGHTAYSCSNTQECDAKSAWARLLSLSLQDFDITRNPPLPLVKSVDGLDNCCGVYRIKLFEAARQFEERFQPVFRFPDQ